MGPLPVTNLGNRYILIAGDLFTKYIKTAALLSIETTIINQVFLDKIVFRRGSPHRFLTDRETNFTSKLLYCYASSFCGSHIRRHNPTKYQFSIWDLFMIVASHSTWGCLDSPQWRIVLKVCYNRNPPLWHSVRKFFNNFLLLPPSQYTIVHLKLLQWRATMITSSWEKLVIARRSQFSCQVNHAYKLI